MASAKRIDLLGAPLDPMSAAESRAAVIDLARRGSGSAHVVTLNPEYVMAARKSPVFAAALRRADLALADGAGVALAARLVGARGTERLTGVEIVELICEQELPVFFLGAGPGVAEKAANRLRSRFPRAEVRGCWAEATASDDDESIRRIAESGARAVMVAFGAEGQVFWIDRNLARLDAAGARLAVGVGGSFDYLSGTVARPPTFVRRLGLEWLWRLAREPWRWRRQTVLPVFAVLVAGAWLKRSVAR